MQPVISIPTFPEDIVNLHEALQALMPPRSDYFKPAGEFPTRDDLVKLARYVGMEGENYGASTSKAVKFFQAQEGLEPRRAGSMDQVTADKMNEYLQDLGAFDDPDKRVVFGQVQYAPAGGTTGAPAPDTPVYVFDESGSRTVVLNRGSTNSDGRYELSFMFSDGQKRWVGVPVAGGGFDPKVQLNRDPDHKIEKNLVVPQVVVTQDFTVQGIVRRAQGEPDAGTPIPAVTVSAFVASESNHKLTPSGTTDASGQYVIKATAKAGATLFVAIESSSGFAVRSSSWTNNGGTTIKDLELAGQASDGAYIVRGRVTGAVPATGVVVRAFDKDIRSEELLGECSPGSDGQYEIRYGRSDFARGEKPGSGAELRMRVMSGDQQLPATASSSAGPYNAPQVTVIDLDVVDQVSMSLSEFERHLADIEPVRDTVPIADFTDADIEFVAGETGIDRTHVAWLALAFKDEVAVKADNKKIPAAAFYGWFREGMPTGLDELEAQPLERLRSTLLQAIDGFIVPASLRNLLDDILTTVPNASRDELIALVTPLGLPDATVGTLGRAAGSVEKVNEPLVTKLVSDGTLSVDQGHAVGLSVSLHGLLGGDMNAVTGLRGFNFETVPGGSLRRGVDLAIPHVQDWIEAFKTTGVIPPDGDTVESYADRFTRSIAQAFPTDTLLHRAADKRGVFEAWTNAQTQILRAKNPNLLDQPWGGLDKSDVAADRLESLRALFDLLVSFTNLHPGLGLRGLYYENADAVTGATQVAKRVEWFQSIHSMNQPTEPGQSGVDLLRIDYLPNSDSIDAVRFGGIPNTVKPLVVANLKSYQRIHAITENAPASEALLRAGFHSAVKLAQASVEQISARSGLALSEAGLYLGRAERQVQRAALRWFSIHDTERDRILLGQRYFTAAPTAYLAELPGYADMFGNISRCECDPCFSVLSPAAYFVDLMHYVEQNILHRAYTKASDGSDYPNGIPEEHPLHLRSRRPDLWTLPLTCENTKEVVPTLDVVNEVLEAFINKAKALASRSEPYAMLAVQDQTPRQPVNWPLEQLTVLLGHFEVDRPQIAHALSLKQEAMTRARLGLSLKGAKRLLDNRLGDPDAAATLYGAWLARGKLPVALDAEIKDIPPRTLVRATGLEHDVLLAVVKSAFVSADNPQKPVTVVTGVGTPGGVQNDTEFIEQLTIRRLDRFEHFVRLWQRLAWSVDELDRVLSKLLVAPALPGQNTLDAFARLLEIQERWQLPVDELCALWDEIPIKGLRSDKSLWDRRFNLPQFVRADGSWPSVDPATGKAPLFLPAALSADGKAKPADSSQQRVMAALQVGDADLVSLFVALRPYLEPKPGSLTAAPEAILLSGSNLFLLYRHARLKRLLGISVAELFQTMALSTSDVDGNPIEVKYVDNLTDLLAVTKTFDDLESTGFTLDEVQFILGKSSQPDNTIVAADEVQQAVQAEAALTFAATVFTQVGLGEAHSKSLIETNLHRIAADTLPLETSPGTVGYRLRVDFDPEDAAWALITAGIPPEVARASLEAVILSIAAKGRFVKGHLAAAGLTLAPTDECKALVDANTGSGQIFEVVADSSGDSYRLRANASQALIVPVSIDPGAALARRAKALLVRYHWRAVLLAKLAVALKLPADKCGALYLLAVQIKPNLKDLLPSALYSGSLEPIATLLGWVSRLSLLFRNSTFDSDALAFVGKSPASFSIDGSGVIGIAAILDAATYSRLAKPRDTAFVPNGSDPNIAALRNLILTNASDPQDLSLALRVDKSRVEALLKALPAAVSSGLSGLSGVSTVAIALGMAERLGVNPEVLKLSLWQAPAAFIASTTDYSSEFADLQRAADGMFALMRSKYPTDSEFQATLEPFEDKLRSRKRYALVEFLTHDYTNADWLRRFAQPNDLYDHFLLDVQVEGCARTSRLVAAISSVQLYVHRALMRLERTSADSDSPLIVGFSQDNTGIQKRSEWEWRKNYRVWEANRKVFLYPESYIEPGLRDDKTPLFRELEDKLLQQEISEQNVLDAYAEYLAGFDELARLKIAGAYHDKTPLSDTLHLFGVTESEPPVYYYRTIDNIDDQASTRYGHWTKINISIPVRKITAIVTSGTLFVFWVETSTRPLSDFQNGNSAFRGYRHTVRTKYSHLRLDGKWTAPQTLRISEDKVPVDAITIPDIFPMTTLSLPLGLSISITAPFHPPWDSVANRIHLEPIESYRPLGWQWDRIYANISMQLGGVIFAFGPRVAEQNPTRNFRAIPELIDFASRSATVSPEIELSLGTALVHLGDTGSTPTMDSIGLQGSMSRPIPTPELPYLYASQNIILKTFSYGDDGIRRLVRFPAGAGLQILAGNELGLFVETKDDGFLLKPERSTTSFTLRRLGTTLSPAMQSWLTLGGIASLLSVENQKKLVEKPFSSMSIDSSVRALVPENGSPFESISTLSTYFQELFFHIPFLIADHLNSRQNFGDAYNWYRYIFDPTAAGPASESESSRPWRYIAFRATQIEPLDKSLTNVHALEAYRLDPFNPYAIARLRPGAYQKAVVMKFIDNLLDWGDSLFSQFTMESVNEATMLYVMASNILGPRPDSLGPCGEKISSEPLTYAAVQADLTESSDILIEETENLDHKSPSSPFTWVGYLPFVPVFYATFDTPPEPDLSLSAAAPTRDLSVGEVGSAEMGFAQPNPIGWNIASPRLVVNTGGTPLGDFTLSGNLGNGSTGIALGLGTGNKPVVATGDPIAPPTPSIGGFGGVFDPLTGVGFGSHVGMVDLHYDLGDAHQFPPYQFPPPSRRGPPQLDLFQLAKASVVFCLPDNKDLRAYWDRVESSLFKIRNCMDISGVRRRLELFAPEIDPHLLVRMKAAGLSLDDVLNATRGNLPPYRFQFLIDKAKQHASLVQSFGNQLLSALEKRDSEELARLRTVHEQNLLQMRTNMMQWEIDAAADTLDSLIRQKATLEFRRDYFNGVVKQGLLPWERTQQLATHAASALLATQMATWLLSGGMHLLPNLGAPTAMTYGGNQIGESVAKFAGALKVSADISELVAKSAGLEAGFQRRDNEWKFQFELASREITQLEKQISASEVRRDIATQTRDVHLRSVEQTQEVYDFMRDRFTNFGRYTWLSERLQGLNRMAFDAALSIARLAEEAYRFERPDQATESLLSGGYWDAANSGLLAGDRLQLDLQNLERRFLETNYRLLEVEQAYSLQQIDPSALTKLRQSGSCSFKVPELFMDLTYPGHYRRRVRAVRLSIPCVVGPYVNVGASLSLTGSRIRMHATDTETTEVPPRHVTSVATSTAQNDSGVFEFSFRDERYMPFEGAGAISDWELRLPSALPSFDYKTISDVILRIAYTASADDKLRTDVEGTTGALAFAVTKLLEDPGLSRVFSLRNDFPVEWARLVNSPVGTEVSISLSSQHLPYFLSGMEFVDQNLELLLSFVGTIKSLANYPEFGIEGETTSDASHKSIFKKDPLTGLPIAKTTQAYAVKGGHKLKVNSAGDLEPAPVSTTSQAAPTLDTGILNDILLRVLLKRKHA